MASGYSASMLTPFVTSARRVMPQSEVDLTLLTNEDAPELSRLSREHGVRLVPFTPAASLYNNTTMPLLLLPVVYRFVLSYRWVEEGSASRGVRAWLVVDCRDVIFQRHVFADAPLEWGFMKGGIGNRTSSATGSLHAPERSSLQYAAGGSPHGSSRGSIVLSLEAYDSILNSSNPALRRLHMGSVRCMYTSGELAGVDVSAKLVNSGVVLGAGPAFTAFLRAYAAELHARGTKSCLWPQRKGAIGKGPMRGRSFAKAAPSWWIPDQLVLNVLAMRRAWGASLHYASNEASILFNVGDGGGLLPKAPEAIPPYGVRTAGLVGLVHQWDRSPALREAITSGRWPGITYT